VVHELRPRAEPLAEYRLASTEALSSRELTVELTDGGTIHVSFRPSGTVAWRAEEAAWFGGAEDPEAPAVTPWSGGGEDPYDAVEVAPWTYFVAIDFARPGLESLTLVLRESTGWALAIHQRRFHPEQTWSRGPAVTQTFLPARIAGREQTGPPPASTRELIGARHLYRYDRHNLYEHVYLSSEKFCAHNLHTTHTPGRADCHPASYHKIDDGLYVFGWREYDSAAAMLVFYNMETLLATGMVHAPETFTRSVNRHLGGHIIPVTSHLDYPDGLEPL
jgi:MoaF C-terminal domain/MoaF N-terminal domain